MKGSQQAFLNRFNELCQEREISQVDLADELNVSSSSVSRWALGKRMPSPDMLNEIAGFFNVSVSYLLGGSEDTIPERNQVPSWFDKWYKEKHTTNTDEKLMLLITADNQEELSDKQKLYIQENLKDLTLAILTGDYDVYDEEYYTVPLIKNRDNTLYLLYCNENNTYAVGVPNQMYTNRLTKKEIQGSQMPYWQSGFAEPLDME